MRNSMLPPLVVQKQIKEGEKGRKDDIRTTGTSNKKNNKK